MACQRVGTYKDRNILEAVRLAPILRHARLVLQDERNLNHSGNTNTHEAVAKRLVRHGTDHECLGMRRHSPAGDKDHESRDEVALGRTVPASAQPNTCQPSTPPDNAHGRVLPVVPDPCGAPAVLGEGVDAAPRRNHHAVEELLATAGPAQPDLSNQEQDQEQDSVGDEGATHNKMRRTLAYVLPLAETKRCDAAEKHLYPRNHREGLAVDAVNKSDRGANAPVDTPFEVQLEVDAQGDLPNHEEEDDRSKPGVYVSRVEFPTAVHVSEGIAQQREGCCKNLERDMPSALDDLVHEKLSAPRNRQPCPSNYSPPEPSPRGIISQTPASVQRCEPIASYPVVSPISISSLPALPLMCRRTIGSTETVAPSGMLPSSCSCANAIGKNAAARTAVTAVEES